MPSQKSPNERDFSPNLTHQLCGEGRLYAVLSGIAPSTMPKCLGSWRQWAILPWDSACLPGHSEPPWNGALCLPTSPFSNPASRGSGRSDKWGNPQPAILAPPGRTSRPHRMRRSLFVGVKARQSAWRGESKDTGCTGDDDANGIDACRWRAFNIGRHLLLIGNMVFLPVTRGRHRKPQSGRCRPDHRPSGGDAPRLDLPRSKTAQYNEGHLKVLKIPPPSPHTHIGFVM